LKSVIGKTAHEIRAEWMKILGCDQKEIDEHCHPSLKLNVDDEIKQYEVAIRLNELGRRL